MLDYYSYLAKNQKDTPENLELLSQREVSERELLELRDMDRNTLLGLMKFCNIRVYDETPVVACTEDELKLAYVCWRSIVIKEKKEKFSSINRKINKYKKMLIQYLHVSGGLL